MQLTEFYRYQKKRNRIRPDRRLLLAEEFSGLLATRCQIKEKKKRPVSSNLTRLMGRFLKQYDREYMKMAMLKHEETFKEQVKELHRLYRVQKMLMRDMKRNEMKRRHISERKKSGPERWNVENKTVSHQACCSYQDQIRPPRTLDLERPAEDYVEDDCRDVMFDVEQECEVELTLATGSRRRKKEDMSLTSDSGASFSSSSTESGGENLKLHEWRLFQMPDTNTSFPGERKSGFDLEEPMRRDRLKQPPWLFQCLSLNMT